MVIYRKVQKNLINRYYKFLWRMGSVQLKPETNIPPILRERGVEILDTSDPYFLQEPPEFNFEWPDPRMNRNINANEHPDFHVQPIFVFDYLGWMRGGLNQVQQMTRTLLHRGSLPKRIVDKVKNSPRSDMHSYFQDGLLYSNLFDASMMRLPKAYKPSKLHLVPPVKYGIQYPRKCMNVLEQITRLCEQYGEGLGEKLCLREAPLVFTFIRSGDKVQIQAPKHHLLYLHPQPLSPYASEDEVKGYYDEQLPSIFPLRPCVGLPEKNLYVDDEISCGFTKKVVSSGYLPATYPDTLFLTSSQPWWNPEQRLGRALMMSFTQCMTIAETLYGLDKELSHPICIKTVITDGRLVDLLCFQLNTTQGYEKDDEGGGNEVKNLAWIDQGNVLYKGIDRKEQKLKQYNPRTISKILALFTDH